MKILAIDTSGLQASAAIVSTCENSSYITVGEIFLNARTGEKSWTHSEILMPGVQQLFELTRLSPVNIDYVAYTCGPGSFTGLRIGAACALGMARALGIPAIAVPTLDALAYNALGVGHECIIIPMLDARRGQVYTAIYGRDIYGEISRMSNYMALSVGEMCQELCKLGKGERNIYFPWSGVVVLGDGADANAAELRKIMPDYTLDLIFSSANNNRQRAASAAVWAAEKILAGHEFSDKVEILYVRAPQAVRESERKSSDL